MENTLTRRYRHSLSWLERAEKVIPLGSQTFSKSRTQFPLGAAPLFIDRAHGCEVVDIDGNYYVDYLCSLGAITLGHGDPDVQAAVLAQMEKGVLFSLASPLEAEVAELIIERIPSAEMVRFGKNGSDATTGCVRLARTYTRRDRVAVCGYHGWQDWYIGVTSRNRGVPKATRDLTHTFSYNDADSLFRLFREYPREFAAVILEPVTLHELDAQFLSDIKDMCKKEGALLIFDEVVTGFRLAPGSAQEMLGITPDLTALGKGLGNGFPISAVAGKEEYMRLMEEVFFSFTMGGEAISLAAAKAVITKGKKVGVYDHLRNVGERLLRGVERLIDKSGLQGIVHIAGHPAWTLMSFSDADGAGGWALRTLYMQEILRRGILTFGVHFISFAHQKEHVDKLLNTYAEVFDILKDALRKGDLKERLECQILKPLFQVRK